MIKKEEVHTVIASLATALGKKPTLMAVCQKLSILWKVKVEELAKQHYIKQLYYGFKSSDRDTQDGEPRIITPPLSLDEIGKPLNEIGVYSDKWKDTRYGKQEEHIRKLFEDDPSNTNLQKIFIKTCVLNTCYSTNIQSPVVIANHIEKLSKHEGLAELIRSGEISAIKKIGLKSDYDEARDIKKSCFSFASKYCHHHNGDAYPIYDRFVCESLWFFHKERGSLSNDKRIQKCTDADKFHKMLQDNCENYELFCEIIKAFRKQYDLADKEKYPTEKVDKYLWLLGKQYFSQKQKKKRKMFETA